MSSGSYPQQGLEATLYHVKKTLEVVSEDLGRLRSKVNDLDKRLAVLQSRLREIQKGEDRREGTTQRLTALETRGTERDRQRSREMLRGLALALGGGGTVVGGVEVIRALLG